MRNFTGSTGVTFPTVGPDLASNGPYDAFVAKVEEVAPSASEDKTGGEHLTRWEESPHVARRRADSGGRFRGRERERHPRASPADRDAHEMNEGSPESPRPVIATNPR
jgi:hypothetical protein